MTLASFSHQAGPPSPQKRVHLQEPSLSTHTFYKSPRSVLKMCFRKLFSMCVSLLDIGVHLVDNMAREKKCNLCASSSFSFYIYIFFMHALKDNLMPFCPDVHHLENYCTHLTVQRMFSFAYEALHICCLGSDVLNVCCFG